MYIFKLKKFKKFLIVPNYINQRERESEKERVRVRQKNKKKIDLFINIFKKTTTTYKKL